MNESELAQLPAALRDKFLRLQESYVQGLTGRLEALRAAYAQKEWAALAAGAHQLCGSAAAYGFPALSALARHVEQAAQEGEESRLAEAMEALDDAMQTILNDRMG